MKKALLIIGFFVSFLICFATLFKLQHWPGAGPLTVLGIFFFCIAFLPLFFIQRMISQKTGLNITVNILGLFTTEMIFFGIMFKTMHWPGGSPMLLLGIVLFLIPTLILYIIQQFRENARKFSDYWKLIAGTIIISVFMMFFALKPSASLMRTFLRVEDGTLKANKNMEAANQRMLAMLVNNSDPAVAKFSGELHASTTEMVANIETIKTALVNMVEFNPEAAKDHWQINAIDNYDIPSHMLGDADSQEGNNLYVELVDYKKQILEKLNALPIADKEKMIADLGDFGIPTEVNQPSDDREVFPTWQQNMFYETTLGGTLATLTSLQNQVLNAEFMTFGMLADRTTKPAAAPEAAAE